MAWCDYERLTALDSSFLEVEDGTSHMHVGAVALFDAEPLRLPDGTIAIERIRRLIEDSFLKFPRYRQRLDWIPLFKRPVWVDDPRFRLNYHVRHTSLPKPGDERQLKRFAARVMSQPLDRSKPLWEMWVVEGVEGDRVALVSKIHHCMIDGASGVDLIGSLLRITPEVDPGLEMPLPRWIPRPKPRPSELLRDEVYRVVTEPLTLAGTLTKSLRRPRQALSSAAETLGAIGEAVAVTLKSGSETPLNRRIGPHRRFDWVGIGLDEIKSVRGRLGGTVNDVVLTVASGALGSFLRGRGVRIENLDFRAMVPVNVRRAQEHGTLGNHVTSMLARLPIAERDPVRRLQQVRELMETLKHSAQAAGILALEELADHTSSTLLPRLAKLGARNRVYNVVVTNVPGPQCPLYMLGSQMRAIFPLVPLFESQALGIAVFSYDGRLYWGLNADYDEVPDLHTVVRAVENEFASLQAATPVEARPTLAVAS